MRKSKAVFRRSVALYGLAAAVLIAALCLASCSGGESGTGEPEVTVQVATVRRKNIAQKVSAEGVLFPLHEANIVPKVSAPVREFHVERGDQVRAGQLLAVLENRDLSASVAENQGAYEQAQASYETTTGATLPEEIQKSQLDVKSASEALKAAQLLYDSRRKLYQQGALARKDLDQSAVALAQARAQARTAEEHLKKLQAVGQKQQVKSAAGQLTAAKGRYEFAQAQLAYSEIRSPINGVVTSRPLYQGEMATAGTPLMTIMDVSEVVARAHIPESQAALLKVGDPAELSAQGTEGAIAGKVTVVSPALDPDSTTVEIWVQAPNPGRRLKPGAAVTVTATAKSVPDALVIPKEALLTNENQKSYVMVAGADGRAHERDVETGIVEDGEVQITGGLKEGERVVTTGAFGLPDNTKLKIEPESGS